MIKDFHQMFSNVIWNKFGNLVKLECFHGFRVLRLNSTTSDLDELSEKMDNEFETIESIIKNALEIVEEYEKQIESSKLKR